MTHFTPPQQPRRLRLCAALLLAFSVPAKAAQAQGTLTVTMQVLPSCDARVDRHTATVSCPPGYAFALTRNRSALALPDTTRATAPTPIELGTETVTIRY